MDGDEEERQEPGGVVVDTIGVQTGEVRYAPWGADRYTEGTTPTTYRYTGQREESYT